MSSLFADTHNVVAILEKSDAAEGFEQIIDFLNRSYIHYALTVNPHIYISCIKQFWNTASVKRSDDVTRLQALVDRKKIMISKDVIREILQLDNAEGVVCLPNEEIFAGLAQMRYEKPSTKLTFYKAFFSSQWKFLIHTLLQSLSAKRTSWNEFSTAMDFVVIYLSTGVETPLFEGMLAARQLAEEGIVEEQVQADDAVIAAVQENVADDVAILSPPSHGAEFPTHFQQVLDTCFALTRRVKNLEHDKAAQKLKIIKLKARVKRLERANKVKSSKLRRLRKVEASKRIESSDDMEDVFNQGRMIDDMDKDERIELAEIYHLDLDHQSKVLSMQEDDSKVQKVVKVVTTAKLITDVVTATSQVSAAIATISAAKPSIPAVAPIVVAAYTRRRKRVIIRDPEEELSSKTLAETPKLKDKGKGILIETPKPMKKKDQIELDAEYARKLHEEINKDHEEINKDIDWDAAIDHNNAGYKMDFFKGMSYDEICPIFQARFDANMRFLFKSREEMEEEDQEVLKNINETPAQKAAKRRKLKEEAQEVKDLKKRLEVVDDENDDVFIEATPLARKVPVVDYQIVWIDNKTRFKIIKADETNQLYISFITLLKNFDREDLENL
nr:hypothetical protein [Tanacetum cinerariifolium]